MDGDVKPANVLVCGDEENKNNVISLINYYSCNNRARESTASRSFCLQQLMTPHYICCT